MKGYKKESGAEFCWDMLASQQRLGGDFKTTSTAFRQLNRGECRRQLIVKCASGTESAGTRDEYRSCSERLESTEHHLMWYGPAHRKKTPTAYCHRSKGPKSRSDPLKLAKEWVEQYATKTPAWYRAKALKEKMRTLNLENNAITPTLAQIPKPQHSTQIVSPSK
jgi:hypothetical protein